MWVGLGQHGHRSHCLSQADIWSKRIWPGRLRGQGIVEGTATGVWSPGLSAATAMSSTEASCSCMCRLARLLSTGHGDRALPQEATWSFL